LLLPLPSVAAPLLLAAPSPAAEDRFGAAAAAPAEGADTAKEGGEAGPFLLRLPILALPPPPVTPLILLLPPP